MQAHGFRVHLLGRLTYLSQGKSKPFRSQARRLAVPFRFQDHRLLITLGDCHGRLLRSFCLGDGGPTAPLGGHLTRHRFLDLFRWRNFPNLYRRDLHPPALGHLVHSGLQEVVDLIALGQHIIERNVTHNRPESRGGNPLRSPGEVLDLDHAGDWVKDSRIDEKVDGDRRIVLRDTGLVRDLQIRLTEVHPNGPIDDRNDDHKTRPLRPWEDFAQTEDDDALIFRDDLDAGDQEDHNHHDCDRQFDGHGDLLIPGDLGVMAMKQTSDGRNDGSTVHETTSDV